MHSLTVESLRKLAKKWGLAGYSQLKKNELLSMLRKGLGGRNLTELTSLAKNLGITGYSRMKKAGLVRKLSTTLRRLAPQDDKIRHKKKASVSRRKKSVLTGKKAPKTKRTRRKPRKKTKSASAGHGAVDLPENYGDGRMVLLARDPSWLYCYWDPNREQSHELDAEGVHTTLRIKRLAPGKPRLVGEIPLPEHARSWYVEVDKPGTSYLAELGAVDSKGKFKCVMVSNSSDTPPGGPSESRGVRFASHSPSKQASRSVAVPEDADRLAEEMHKISSAVDPAPAGSLGDSASRPWVTESVSSTGGQKDSG